MRLTKDQVRRAADVTEALLDAGATAVGVAPAAALEGAPAGHRPSDIIAEARSLIVYGVKLVGIDANWPALVWDDTRQTRINAWYVYDRCCFDAVNLRLVQLGMDLSIAYELQGYQAYFQAGTNDSADDIERRSGGPRELLQPIDQEKVRALADLVETPSRYGAPISLRHAAVVAGLGTFGANNLALHPIFGPRMRYNIVITDCELDAYDVPLTEPVCLYDQGCRVCEAACPHGVFHEAGRFAFAGLDNPWLAMRGPCYHNGVYCGGLCLVTCPAGSGDRAMKANLARRYPAVRKILARLEEKAGGH